MHGAKLTRKLFTSVMRNDGLGVAEIVHFRKIVIVKDDIIPWHDEKGIPYLGVEKFLLDESAIDL